MRFCFQIGKFLIKTQCIALHFYLGLKNEPWFGPAVFKALLREAFSASVYFMQLRFQSNYLGNFNQRNFFENTTAYSKRPLKTRVAMQLKLLFVTFEIFK